MRRLLVLFALLGLLYSPAAAVAAQQDCAQGGAAMAGMMMSQSSPKPAPPAADPCCDHSQQTPDSKACVQACATMCGVVAALPTPVVFVAPRARESLVATPALALKPVPPPRNERPPKLIA